MLTRFLQLVRELEPNRHFLKLWFSQALSLTAFNMVNFTLLIRVFELTGSATMVSLFILSFGLPSLLFGAVAGVFADRWHRRSVLIVTNVLRAALVLLYLTDLSSIPVLLAVTFAISTVTQFFTPSEGAAIPELVEPKRLVAANAVFIVTMFASFVVGYGLAGPISQIGGDSLPIFLAAGSFIAAAAACALLPPLHQRMRKVALRDAYRSVIHELKDGFSVVRRTPLLRYGLLQMTAVWTAVGVVIVLLPSFVGEVLGANLREVSRIVILPIGVGMLAGGIVLHRARQQFPIRFVTTGALLLAGLMIILLGQIETAAAALARVTDGNAMAIREGITSIAATVLGLSISMVMIASQTLIHEQTDRPMRGRVFGFLGMSVNLANTAPVLLAGALVDTYAVTSVVTVLGGLLLVWAIIALPVGRNATAKNA
ncbi:MAG: MFS transporter [bacterium]|nr:MFS transporter [bacterium]